jgi:hypothetical protein
LMREMMSPRRHRVAPSERPCPCWRRMLGDAARRRRLRGAARP